MWLQGLRDQRVFCYLFLHMSDVTFDMRDNKVEVHHQKAEPWRVTLVDTGENTMTGGRLKRVSNYLKGEKHSVSRMVMGSAISILLPC